MDLLTVRALLLGIRYMKVKALECGGGEEYRVTQGGTEVLFFSRGRGRGHAVPDSSLVSSLLKMRPDLNVAFVSYGLGAETLRSRRWPVIDLKLPEDNAFWETACRSLRVIQEKRPRLVISHEEFCVPPLATACEVPSVLITDWLPPLGSIAMQAIEYARSVIFIDEQGYSDIPDQLKTKLIFVGPLLQLTKTTWADREQGRRELGVDEHTRLIVVLPGGAGQHAEDKAPITDILLEAFEMLPIRSKRLLWVAGQADYGTICARARTKKSITVLRPVINALKLMAAADLVVTKGNRITVLESDALGVPSISISHGNNPIDDNRLSRIRSHVALRAKGIDAEHVSASISVALQRRVVLNPYPTESIRLSVDRATHLILEML